MAKRIIWTNRADFVFTRILDFYIERNGSKDYSRKLNKSIHKLITILGKQPYIGVKTNVKQIRVFIKDHYKIFYQIEKTAIIIHLVWDCRQNPDSINLS